MEAFSKRLHSSTLKYEKSGSVATLTPARFCWLFEQRAHEICAHFEEWTSPLTIIGRLGSVSPDAWRRHEALPLVDQEAGTEVFLEVPVEVMRETTVQPGDIVRAVGIPRVRLLDHTLTCRLRVVALEAYKPAASHRETQPDHHFAALLRGLPAEYHRFPQRTDARLLVLGEGLSMAYLEKFRESLGGLWPHQAVRMLALSNAHVVHLVEALQESTEDIVVLLIQGNVAAILEDHTVLSSLAVHRGHRILAVQGEQESLGLLIAPHLVDHYAHSFQDVGHYVRQESAQVWKEKEEAQALQEELSALRVSIEKLTLPSTHKILTAGRVIAAIIIVFLLGCIGIMARHLMTEGHF